MRLLVSPRDIEEAKRSCAADIIDVKRPAEGSLGANFPWIIRAVRELSGKPVSAAIGDFDFRPGGASLAAYGAAHAGADYVKIGNVQEPGLHRPEVAFRVCRGRYPPGEGAITRPVPFFPVDNEPPFQVHRENQIHGVA